MQTTLDTLFEDFERQFDRLRGITSLAGTARMLMDGVRRSDEVLLCFDLPGVDPDTIEVTVDRGVLTVSAHREETYGQDERLFVQERPMGTFTRHVYLSEHLDADHIEAACHNGVLTVRIPVLETARPRRIEIATGGDAKAINT
ncbi:Hsp20/alpha crystallin family protein [Nonomuraea sp. NBC_00507]|uniref:Hsp20/alpha crystallin family protein n=1 Tax=Nonomuraea sp. NBC_00507 TaxID=2976002 RepID=UPI002E174916